MGTDLFEFEGKTYHAGQFTNARKLVNNRGKLFIKREQHPRNWKLMEVMQVTQIICATNPHYELRISAKEHLPVRIRQQFDSLRRDVRMANSERLVSAARLRADALLRDSALETILLRLTIITNARTTMFERLLKTALLKADA